MTHTVTLQETQQAMEELIIPGLAPNGKLAYWNSALSIRNDLARNCKQAAIMRTYVNRPLPVNRDELRAELGNPMTRTVNTLYEIEKLWNVGIIHFHCGTTFDEQSRWRLSMCAAIPGMSFKTISFALHIYAPFECLLLTIDCHHARRLGIDPNKITTKVYIQAEAELYRQIVELSTYESQGYAPIVYAACLWERWRKANGNGVTKKQSGDEYQSHAGLSCYC